MIRNYKLEDILTITHDRWLTEDAVNLTSLVAYLMGDPDGHVFMGATMNQLLPVAREALFKQHQALRYVDASECSKETYKKWLIEQKRIFGDTLPVSLLQSA